MQRLISLLTVATFAAACTSANETGDTGPECPNEVVTAFPENGETQAYYRTVVEVRFDDMEEGASFTVTNDATGTQLTGQTSWRGDSLVFEPDADLDPMTDYTVNVSFSCGEPVIQWSTGEVGGAVTTDLVGKSYNLDLASGRFTEPPDVGSILQSFIGEQRILLGVTALEGSNIHMIGAMGVEGSDPAVQSPCEPSIPFPVADFSDSPYFQVGPEDTAFNVSGYEIAISDLYISGAFAPDGSYIAGAELSGSVDTRPLVILIGEEEEPDAICEIVAAIGVECEPCESDGEPFCLSVKADSIEAVELEDYSLTEIIDPCLLPECAKDPDCLEE